MAINSSNFCRIETVEGSIQVLFWCEFEGDEIKIHQVTTPSIGTVDVTLRGPAEKMEIIWTGDGFPDAAKKVVDHIRAIGLSFGD